MHERLHSAVDLASNTREVGTQTGESSQNKTNFFELVLNKTQKGFKRLTEKIRLGESCINLVHKKEKKEEVKESNTIQFSEDNEKVSTLNLLDTSNTADKQTLLNSYNELSNNELPNNELPNNELPNNKLPPNLFVLGGVKIGLNENVNLPIPIEPNASIEFGAKFLQKMASNINLTSSGRLNEPTSLDSIGIDFDSNISNFQKGIGLYLNNSPGQCIGLTIITQGENRVGIPMTENLANAFNNIKVGYYGSNKDSTPDRYLSPIRGGVNAINNTIARCIIPKLKNNTEKGKVSDNVKITDLAGRIGQGTPLNNPVASKTESALNVKPATSGPRSQNKSVRQTVPSAAGYSAAGYSAAGEGFRNNRGEAKLSPQQSLFSNRLSSLKPEDKQKGESFVTRAYDHRESQSVGSLSEFFSQEASQNEEPLDPLSLLDPPPLQKDSEDETLDLFKKSKKKVMMT